MRRPLKLIRSLLKEIEGLRLDGPDRPDMPALIIFYEAWYTKALNIVQNLIPDRLEDFVSAYKQNRTAPPTFSNYSIQDYFLGIKVEKSSIAEFNPGRLFKQLVLRQAGILSSALRSQTVSEAVSESVSQENFYRRAFEQAEKLFQIGKTRPAGVFAAIVIDNYLRWLWKKRNLNINDKEFSLAEINDYLHKFQTYKEVTHIRIQSLIPTTEACLDPEKKPPSKKEIELLIDNVRKVIGTVS